MLRRSSLPRLALAASLLLGPPAHAAKKAAPTAPAKAAPAAASAARTPVLPAPAAPLAKVPRTAAPDVPAALPQLERLADPGASIELGTLSFDGSGPRAADAAAPAAAPAGDESSHARPQKPFLRRAYHTGLASAVGASLAPAAWQAEPATSAVMFAAAAVLAVDAAWLAGRLLAAMRPIHGRRWAAWTGGALIGVSAAVGAHLHHAELALFADSVLNRPAAAAAIRRGTLEAAVIEELSANPEGRRVLDRLRDRGGAVRLPPFALKAWIDGDALAGYSGIYNMVFLNGRKMRERGFDPEQVLRDPARLRAYIRENADIVVHELVHAAQYRPWPFVHAGIRGDSNALEHEAFLAQHFYRHEQLRRQPDWGTKLALEEYELMLDDLDAFLARIDRLYVKGTPRTPGYLAMRAAWQKDWRAHRVEGYGFLARRHAGSPLEARYLEKQRRAAEVK